MRLLAALGLLLAGAVTAVATVAVHELVWGFVLAVAATSMTVLALPPGWWSRLAFVVGWVAMVGWLTVPRPEGDYLVSQDWQGYAVLGLGMVLLVVGLATLPRPRGPATGAP
ncbi:DUF6113 family protein [Nocardioides sp. URHA0020]|uniref:DUF6113 family protein n=1 Tax=Nocardioides sp. URHA0020 TaxID=1380392 RepID=UPI00049193B0|nr:hypothetical protein [Nocardioides sp. URHA0020]